MAVLADWRMAWVTRNGRWDRDGAEFITEALESGDWTTVQEFAEVVPWGQWDRC